MTRHMIVPDTQIKPDSSIKHLKWAGEYAVKHKPDVIIHIGDHWDLPSLSSYDKGTMAFEGRRYLADIEAGKKGMKAFLKPIRDEQKRLRKNKKTVWKPRLVFCLGNHENRIKKAISLDPRLEGSKYGISFKHLQTDHYFDEYHEYRNSGQMGCT